MFIVKYWLQGWISPLDQACYLLESSIFMLIFVCLPESKSSLTSSNMMALSFSLPSSLSFCCN